MNALEIAALGMQTDMDRLNSVSQNLANVATPGYKRVVQVHTPFGQVLDGAQPPTSAEQAVDIRAGALKPTGRALDIAVDDGAFVELRSDRGLLSYSRGGSFEMDAAGRVIGPDGSVLQLLDGDLKLHGSPADVRIDARGEVFVGEERIGQLRLVRFDAPQKMRALGGGRYDAGTARITDDPARSTVRSGTLEGSNVQSTQEMVRLLETSRHFEAMQKVVQGYDEVLEKAIRKLGEV